MSSHEQKSIEQAIKVIEKEQKAKTEEVTKEQVLLSALGYYLPAIMSSQELSISESTNVFKIWGSKEQIRKNLPSYSNILTKKQTDKNICDLEIFKNLQENALFLSQAVPYVKIYKTISKNGQKIDINLPFDIVAGQRYGDPETLTDKILQGGSGGAVGVASFNWKSEGKNEGNISLYTVNFKLVLQDAAQLTKIRNKNQEEEVRILDLLYYGFLDKPGDDGSSNSEITNTNEPDYLEFKAELGFNFSSLYQEYNQYFKTMLNLRVYKHNFNFDQSGKVELEIVAIGNIESDFSNKVKHNILENQQTKNILKVLEFLEKIKNLGSVAAMKREVGNLQTTNTAVFKLFQETMIASEKAIQDKVDFEDIVGATFGLVLGTAGLAVLTFATGGFATLFGVGAATIGGAGTVSTFTNTDVEDRNEDYNFYLEKINVGISHLRQYIKLIKINILETIFKQLKEKQKIKYFILEYDKFISLKEFIAIGEISQSQMDRRFVLETLTNLAIPPEIGKIDKNEGTNVFNYQQQSVWASNNVASHVFSSSPTNGVASENFVNTYNITPNDPVSSIRKKINDGKPEGKQSEIVSFVSLGDLLQIFIDQDISIKENTNLFLGPFSFYNYQKTFNNFLSKPNALQNGNQNKYLIQKMEKEIGSMYDIPISISSLQKWFIDLIQSKEEQAYSFNNFLKFATSDLIRQNIAIKVAPSSPYNIISFNPYYFSTTKEDFEKILSIQQNQTPIQQNQTPIQQNQTNTRFSSASYADNILKNYFSGNKMINTTNKTNIINMSYLYSKRQTKNINYQNIKNNIAFISVAEYSLEEGSYKGDFQKDCEHNIFHIFVNSLSSFVKNISFSRDDDARLETANLLAANDANPNKIIRQVYQANVSMFGNCFFEPGNLIYIKANYPGLPIGNNVLEQIGLGGYYRIIEIDNKISTSGFSTDLKCIWEMSSDGSVGTNQQQALKISLVKENDQN